MVKTDPLRLPLGLEQPARYLISVQGWLDEARAVWFTGLTITYTDNDTILTGIVQDQAALHGILAQVRDLGLPLLEVHYIEACTDKDNNRE